MSSHGQGVSVCVWECVCVCARACVCAHTLFCRANIFPASKIVFGLCDEIQLIRVSSLFQRALLFGGDSLNKCERYCFVRAWPSPALEWDVELHATCPASALGVGRLIALPQFTCPWWRGVRQDGAGSVLGGEAAGMFWWCSVMEKPQRRQPQPRQNCSLEHKMPKDLWETARG